MNFRVIVTYTSLQAYELKCVSGCKYFNGHNCEATLKSVGQCPWNLTQRRTFEVFVEDELGDSEAAWEAAVEEVAVRLTFYDAPVFHEVFAVTPYCQMLENGVKPFVEAQR